MFETGKEMTEIQLNDTASLLGEMAAKFIDGGNLASGARGRSQVSEIVIVGGGGLGEDADSTSLRTSPKDFELYTRDLVTYPQAATELRESDTNQRGQVFPQKYV